ncbi:hypothetical protein [Gloeothece verrucosa]|uniref:Uncharacterized protein n=1 Tax=Gloeothece verrucosa (strain PCC 7822) TaxID=497965 RepID=E0UMC1_GLOV7|nr:hypothetical protein [Gloeothece verrucosa]ADN18101.1 hypothetical protein Cyan7822_6304 [Gloeothece verrucosa PCC 7822]
MNQTTLKIKIESVTPVEYSEDGGVKKVSGSCWFQFYDTNSKQTLQSSIEFDAYNGTGGAILNAGENAVWIAVGRLDIFKPSQTSPNHSLLLHIQQAFLVNAAPASIDAAPVAIPEVIVPVSKPKLELVGAGVGAGAHQNGKKPIDDNCDDIPF